jgi:hypothetical protein
MEIRVWSLPGLYMSRGLEFQLLSDGQRMKKIKKGIEAVGRMGA